jgi:hypothetical protein
VLYLIYYTNNNIAIQQCYVGEEEGIISFTAAVLFCTYTATLVERIKIKIPNSLLFVAISLWKHLRSNIPIYIAEHDAIVHSF